MFALLVAFLMQTPDDLRGKSVVHLFTPFEYQVGNGSVGHRAIPYRVFMPETHDDGKRFPLIVWMHGEGESGDDNVSHLRWLRLILKDTTDRSRYRFFILAVQKPLNEPWGSSDDVQGDEKEDMLGIVSSIIRAVIRDYSIDPDRVYLSGVSAGGTACWNLGIRYPGLFAAIAPLASGGSNDHQVTRLIHVPVRAFQSEFEMGSALDSVKRSVNLLSSAGGSASLVEIETNRHDCWTAAFEEHHLLDWLLLQTRRLPPRELEGHLVENCREFLVAYGWIALLSTTLVIAWRLERSRRKLPGGSTTSSAE